MKMDVDETLLKLGKYNKRRIAIYCMICCSSLMTACWHMMGGVFIGNNNNVFHLEAIARLTHTHTVYREAHKTSRTLELNYLFYFIMKIVQQYTYTEKIN